MCEFGNMPCSGDGAIGYRDRASTAKASGFRDGAQFAESFADGSFVPPNKKTEVTTMGALLPWRPFRELERIARRLESPFRLFDELEDVREEAFLPAIESYVKEGSLVVRADVPGLDPKDIDVSILGNVLTVKGERKSEQEVKKEDYLRREVSYGSFERRMTLPEGTETDKVKASFRNGVLEVTLPLGKEAVARKVPIEAQAEQKIEVAKK
jgi:HSP20 family protein